MYQRLYLQLMVLLRTGETFKRWVLVEESENPGGRGVPLKGILGP
jgi:hypothetical protein